MRFQGEVRKGHGSAKIDFRKGRYEEVDFGFEPYPGTLNLYCRNAPRLPEPDITMRFSDRTPIHLWRARAARQDVWVLRQPGWGDHQVELVAAERLREHYENGDALWITLRSNR